MLRSNTKDAFLLESKSIIKFFQHFLKSLLTYGHRDNNEMRTIKLILRIIALFRVYIDSSKSNDKGNIKEEGQRGKSRTRTNQERDWKLVDPVR